MAVFSDRLGIEKPEPSIKYREDASQNVRDMAITIAGNYGLRPSVIRNILCGLLCVSTDQSNWSEFPNIDHECRNLIGDCHWYEVYDAIELFDQKIRSEFSFHDAFAFEENINRLLIRDGAGWRIENGSIVARGSEPFNATTREAYTVLTVSGNSTAASEIHEAIKDISRRPSPDRTGAVQHAMAAMECLTRSVAGAPKLTLGEILKDKSRSHNIPSPIDDGLIKLWGYASERGRHIREGNEPTFDEAELIVTISSAICVYLARKWP